MGLLAEYEAQDQWRDWDAVLHRLPIVRDQTVIDIGCGPGLVSARLAMRAANIVGVDQNTELLSAARQRCPTNCTFLKADLQAFNTSRIPIADGLWCSFTAAYFSDFAPILNRWISCLSPGAWVALVEIDDLWTGHHPLPAEVHAAFTEFAEYMRAEGYYDCRMGRRLSSVCRNVGLTIKAEHRRNDPELAFDGPAPPAILFAWQRRFARMPVMKAYFGDDRFNEITRTFLDTISRPDHRSTAVVTIVQAECPS